MDTTKRERRFQFSLRTLLIVVTLLAIPMGYVGWQAKIVRERQAAMQTLRHAYAVKAAASDINLVRRCLGDVAIDSIWFDEGASDQEVEGATHAFSEAVIWRGLLPVRQNPSTHD